MEIKSPGIIIQARVESKRFPGKMLKTLANKTVIEHILERLKKCKSVKKIILAVPNNKNNLKFAKIAKKLNVNFFFGSENNLVKRYFDAAVKFNIDPIVRIPGDNIIPEPKEIDKIINHHLKQNKKVFSSNLSPFLNSGYPDGIGAEVFDFSLLEKVKKKNLSKKRKEHVHLNFINYKLGKPIDPKLCSISTIKCPKSFAKPDYVFDINYKNQYLMFKKMYIELYKKNKFFTVNDAINWVNKFNLKKNEKIR